MESGVTALSPRRDGADRVTMTPSGMAADGRTPFKAAGDFGLIVLARWSRPIEKPTVPKLLYAARDGLPAPLRGAPWGVSSNTRTLSTPVICIVP